MTGRRPSLTKESEEFGSDGGFLGFGGTEWSEAVERGDHSSMVRRKSLSGIALQLDTEESRQALVERDVVLRSEMALKRMGLELEELRAESVQATQIIGTLNSENEQLKAEKEALSEENAMLDRDLGMGLEKCDVLEDMLADARSSEELAQDALGELTERLEQLQQLLQDERRKSHKALSGLGPLDDHSLEDGDLIDSELGADGRKAGKFGRSKDGSVAFDSKKEKEFYEEMEDARRQCDELNRTLEEMAEDIGEFQDNADDIVEMRDEFFKARELMAVDLDDLENQNEVLATEMIQLVATNARMEKDTIDMQSQLEERDYKCQMLEKLCQLSGITVPTDTRDAMRAISRRMMTLNAETFARVLGEGSRRSSLSGAPGAKGSWDSVDGSGTDGHGRRGSSAADTLGDMLISARGVDDDEALSDMEVFSDDELTSDKAVIVVQKQPEVPDVIREYLHLTASVVKMKFPRSQLSSEELIKRVRAKQFYEYFDHMVLVLKHEESQMKELEQLEAEKRRAARVAARGGRAAAGKAAANSWYTKWATKLPYVGDYFAAAPYGGGHSKSKRAATVSGPSVSKGVSPKKRPMGPPPEPDAKAKAKAKAKRGAAVRRSPAIVGMAGGGGAAVGRQLGRQRDVGDGKAGASWWRSGKYGYGGKAWQPPSRKTSAEKKRSKTVGDCADGGKPHSHKRAAKAKIKVEENEEELKESVDFDEDSSLKVDMSAFGASHAGIVTQTPDDEELERRRLKQSGKVYEVVLDPKLARLKQAQAAKSGTTAGGGQTASVRHVKRRSLAGKIRSRARSIGEAVRRGKTPTPEPPSMRSASKRHGHGSAVADDMTATRSCPPPADVKSGSQSTTVSLSSPPLVGGSAAVAGAGTVQTDEVSHSFPDVGDGTAVAGALKTEEKASDECDATGDDADFDEEDEVEDNSDEGADENEGLGDVQFSSTASSSAQKHSVSLSQAEFASVGSLTDVTSSDDQSDLSLVGGFVSLGSPLQRGARGSITDES